MSGGGSQQPSGSTTTVQKSDPWSVQQPFLQTGFNQAQSLFNTGGPQYYPGQTYSPETATQSTALADTSALGLGGGPSSSSGANSAVSNILDPNFLNSNPGNAAYNGILSGNSPAINAAVANATPGLLDTFTGGGTVTAGSAAPYAVGKGVGNAVAGAMLPAAAGLSGNYGQAAGQQNTAAAFGAPAASQLAYGNLSNAYGAGAQQQTMGQNTINDQLSRYNYGQTQPYNLLDWYNGAVGGSFGGTSTLTSPYFTQRSGGLGGALGGAASGAALGSMFGPWGTGIGAVGGGLLGGFG